MQLANAERCWAHDERDQATDVEAEVRRRLGRVPERCQVLPGGLANLSVRIADDRVLRIYRRDPRTATKEARLLSHRWSSFRVPRVLRRGRDSLLLEYVEHEPLEDDARSGRDIGLALAEIHAQRFEVCGDLNGRLEVREPMPDVLGVLCASSRGNIERLGASQPALPASVVTVAERAAALLERSAPLLNEHLGPPVRLHSDFKVSNLHRATTGELLVLDWEFALAGPALCDAGQLLRWGVSVEFVEAFASAYREAGGVLPDGWQRFAELLDLSNLIGLLVGRPSDGQRVNDLTGRMAATLADARQQPQSSS